MAQWNKNTQDYLNQERTLHEVIMCADRYGNIGNCGVDGTGAVGTDAFGRMRISQPLTLFDSSHRYRDNNLWEESLVGTGATVGFSTTEGLVNIGIGTTSGCSAIRETTKTFSYQPGKSLLILNTFVPATPKENLRQRIGYFGADNGMYFEINGTTPYFVERSLSTGTQTAVAQDDWNIDKLDGTGVSAIKVLRVSSDFPGWYENVFVVSLITESPLVVPIPILIKP